MGRKDLAGQSRSAKTAFTTAFGLRVDRISVEGFGWNGVIDLGSVVRRVGVRDSAVRLSKAGGE